jgi:hypothetical protein
LIRMQDVWWVACHPQEEKVSWTACSRSKMQIRSLVVADALQVTLWTKRKESWFFNARYFQVWAPKVLYCCIAFLFSFATLLLYTLV